MSFLSDLQTMYEAGSGTLTLDTAKLGPTGEKLRQLTGSGTLTVTGYGRLLRNRGDHYL